MTTIERLHEWRNIMHAQQIKEDPSIAAGRQAEEFLRVLVETNLKHKGAFCFLGKRVRSKKHKRRFEIDLIVLTKKHLHILEVKNWSGEVVKNGKEWIQIRRHGDRVSHPNLTRYNSKKQAVIIEYLRSQGVKLKHSYFSQKVIFMNPNLRIAPEIASDPNVVPVQKLDKYLSTQKGTSYAERFIHSVVDICIDSEKSSIILDGLFRSMNKADFQTTQKALSELRTWDKVIFNGGRVVTGDCLKLYTSTNTIKMKSLPSGTRCKVAWNRSKLGGLLQGLLTKMPMGRVKLPDRWLPLETSDAIKFHFAGEESPRNILLRDVDLIVMG